MPEYFNTSEVAAMLQIPASTLRFWQKEFADYLHVDKMSGKYRFSEENLAQLARIKSLLQEDLYTIEGARRRLDQEEIDSEAEREMLAEQMAALREEIQLLREELQNEVRSVRDQIANTTEEVKSLGSQPVTIATISQEEISLRKIRRSSRLKSILKSIGRIVGGFRKDTEGGMK